MEERKIKMTVNKYTSFQEAEDADDHYWANTSPEERLNELYALRKSFFSEGNELYPGEMKRCVIKKQIRKSEQCF